MGMEVGGRHRPVSFFTLFFETLSLTEHGARRLARLAWQQPSWIPLSPSLNYRHMLTLPAFPVSAGHLNSGPLACIAKTLIH